MGNLSDIDPVIALLYDGVTNSGDWYDGLDAVAQAFGSVGFHYLAMDGQSGALLDTMATFGMSPESVHAYETQYVHDDPRMAIAMRQPAGHSWADHDYLDHKVVSRAPIYNELLIPNGACYTLALRIRADAERSEFLGYFRPADAPLTSDGERQFLRRLTPHIQRASLLRTRMADLSRHAAIGLSALEHVPQGVAVVDGQGRIQHMNGATERLVQADGPCRVKGGRLAFADGQDEQQFQRLLAAACAQGPQRPLPKSAVGGGAATAGAFRLRGKVPGGPGGPAMVVSLIPLKASHPLAVFRQIHLALVVFASPGQQVGVDGLVLQELWGLTPTESRLARALTAGQSIKAFAEAEGCSWHTARTHLRNTLRKCGCGRQLDLVQLVQSLQLGLR